MTRPPFSTWADVVTISRVVLLPVLILTGEAVHAAVDAGGAGTSPRTFVLALLLAIGASDKLDGWLARRSGQPPTKRGAILDAAADRLVQWTGVWYFTLRGAPAFTPLPIWLAGTLVLRDALLLAILLRQRRPKAASYEHELHGKAATVTIFLALLAPAAGASRAWTFLAALVAGLSVMYSTARYAMRLVGRTSSKTTSQPRMVE
ncbi:MAG: CDP-alcohol phosphatidyltransferase family protein [Gemmatimonadales bacterium]